MLHLILHHKREFVRIHGDKFSCINSFIEELAKYVDKNPFLIDSSSFWKNYTHAIHLSVLMEKLGYNLDHWNAYIRNQDRVIQLLGIGRIGKNQEGKVLELFVLHSINYVFDFSQSQLKISAAISNDDKAPKYLTNDSHQLNVFTKEENERLIGNVKSVMKIRGQKKKEIWGDNDVIVLMDQNGMKQQFCIISCKMSLRERVYQSVFWSMHSRLQGIGRHVFVTADKGTSSGTSEIGNRDKNNKAKKSRDVLESTMDRVYVLRNNDEVNRSQVIKDFEFLEIDLIQWAKDIAGES